MPLLTVRAIETHKAKAKPYKLTLDRGLQLRIAPDGVRTLLVRYSVKGSDVERQYRLPQEYGEGPGQMKLATACGGGGGDSDPPDDGGGKEPPSASINVLEGDWVQKGCVKAGAQSFKKILRARITAPNTLDYSEGVLTFGGNECAGPSQVAGPTKLGVVTFARSEANQALAAHWGELRTVTGTRFGAIWTLRPTNLLCLLGDGIPTSQPSLSSVASSLATIPADNCFTR